MNYWDEQMAEVMGEAMSTPFDLVLGRKTYDIFAAVWPHAADDAGAKPSNDARKHVASRSRPKLDRRNSRSSKDTPRRHPPVVLSRARQGGACVPVPSFA